MKGTRAFFIEPMFCLAIDRLPASRQRQFELKFDGYRALGIKSREKVQLRSRNDKDFTSRYYFADSIRHFRNTGLL